MGGPRGDLAGAVDLDGARVIDARGGFVGPGLVDPHTHLVFAGERAAEFELRCPGASYLQIAHAGGGIARHHPRHPGRRATRRSSRPPCAAPGGLLAQGVTTAEVKSGYGLDVEAELQAAAGDPAARPRALQPT